MKVVTREQSHLRKIEEGSQRRLSWALEDQMPIGDTDESGGGG